jgi:transcription elongation factor Elf1
MTPRKPLQELERRNRATGELLRALLNCPLCGESVKVVAYRHRTIRFECLRCGLRFSIDRRGFDTAVDRLDEAGHEPAVDNLVALLSIPPRPRAEDEE